MTLTLLGLAAGVGSRFGGPKQLEPLGPHGETILDYSIHDGLRAGFAAVVLVVRPELRDAFERGLVARWRSRVPIALVEQRTAPPRAKPWGTAHAVLSAAGAIGGPFAVVNGDDFYGRDAYAQLGHFLAERPAGDATHAAVGFPLGATLTAAGGVNRAVLATDAEGFLVSAEEVRGIERDEHGDGVAYGPDAVRVIAATTPVSMNMWGFTPAVLPELATGFDAFRRACANDASAEYLLPARVTELVNERRARVRVLPGTGPWLGMTYPADREPVARALAALVASGEYPSPVWR